MSHDVDIVLINPGDRRETYQALGNEFSAVETPYWSAALAAWLRDQGFSAAIIDANAENITPEETAKRVNALNPPLAAVIVYGSQPSASTQTMPVAGRICTALSELCSTKVAIGGGHPSALPGRTLEDENVDYVLQGEGFHTIAGLLKHIKGESTDLSDIPGLWYTENGVPSHTERAELMDTATEWPMAAWDLLPMEKYVAHNWHCFDHINDRAPYAAVYTSLGCPYSCDFCCINAPFGKCGIRFRDPLQVVDELEVLHRKYGVKNIKFIDELFVLKESHYLTIVDGIIEKGLDLNIWAYARVDTVKEENLKRMKQAGINWVALGIEAGNPEVRKSVSKSIKPTNIDGVVQSIRDAGMYIIGNYIFGLPEDTMGTLQETLDMATRLNCEFINFYCTMAYPGSALYDQAVTEDWALPEAWGGFSQHAYETRPLDTRTARASDVLRFRDIAFQKYFANPEYLDMIETKFGTEVREHLTRMNELTLKRKICGD